LWRAVGGIADEIVGGFDIGGGDGAAVVEVNALAEMEDVGERVGNGPGFGEIAVEVHLGVALEEAGEEEAVKMSGLAVGGVARVEIGGVRFQEKG
jgi:hypothetical protein